MGRRRPRRQISEGRKGLYYTGMVLMVIGVISFLSTFVTFLINFGDFSNFDANVRSDGFRAIGGMILIGIGSFLRHMGSQGIAGSGVVLDPERAREDLEPWNRMKGGMVSDALEEADLGRHLGGALRGREGDGQDREGKACPGCSKENDPDSAFCKHCGSPFPLDPVCGSCGTRNDGDARFCDACGARL